MRWGLQKGGKGVAGEAQVDGGKGGLMARGVCVGLEVSMGIWGGKMMIFKHFPAIFSFLETKKKPLMKKKKKRNEKRWENSQSFLGLVNGFFWCLEGFLFLLAGLMAILFLLFFFFFFYDELPFFFLHFFFIFFFFIFFLYFPLSWVYF